MKHAFCALPQNRKPHRRPTSWFCLWFWRNRYNAVAMFLARAFRTGIHPPEITQNGGCSGAWMRLVSTLARNMASAFWWRIMAWLSRPSVRSLFCGIRSKHTNTTHACITKHINYKLPMKILASTLKSFAFVEHSHFLDTLVFRCDFLVEYSTFADTVERLPVPLGH
jgi:hypothetical protein